MIRPIFFDFPNDGEAIRVGMEANEFMIGKDIIVIPVVSEKTKKIKSYLPRINLPHYYRNEDEIKKYESGEEGKENLTGIWYSFHDYNITDDGSDKLVKDNKIKNKDASLMFKPGYHVLNVGLENIPVFLRGVKKKYKILFFLCIYM